MRKSDAKERQGEESKEEEVCKSIGGGIYRTKWTNKLMK